MQAQQIQTELDNLFRELSAELKDDRLLSVVLLAVCGHMTNEQQNSFLEEAKRRGILGGLHNVDMEN